MKKIMVAVLVMGLILITAFSTVSISAFTIENINSVYCKDSDDLGVERWAVLVGASGDIYGHDDAIDFNDTLVNHGWQVDHIKVLTNPAFHRDQWHILANKENIISAIRWMNDSEDEDDVVLFFFSCHGGYGEIYAGNGEAITCEELNDELDGFESKNIVIIFNSCFSGSMVSFGSTLSVQEEQIEGVYGNNNVIGSVGFLPGMNIETQQVSLGSSGLESSGSNGLDKPGRVILMSSGRFEISWSSYILENGIFSYFVIKGFDGDAEDVNQDGWISAEEAFKFANPRTTLFARLKLICFQHPKIYDGYDGELNLIRC